jgi:hypothetical protein
MAQHPELPRCDDCRQWLYTPDWRLQRRPHPDGPPVPRPKGSSPPCSDCPKIPRPLPVGERAWWGLAAELSEENARCLEHYRECVAVGWQVPDALDPLVRRHAALIRGEDEAVERGRQSALLGLLAMGTAAKRKRGE